MKNQLILLRSDLDRHIPLSDERQMTTNEAICEAFRPYFQELSPVLFDTYLANFPHSETAEATGCEGAEAKIWGALKQVGGDKTLQIDCFPQRCT